MNKYFSTILLALAILFLASSASGQEIETTFEMKVVPHTEGSLDSFNYEMVDLFNQERSKRLLKKLVYDRSKQKALNDKAKRMSRKGGYKHDNSGFDGEIIQLVYSPISAEYAIKRWMDSPGHRAIIISRRDGYKKVCAGNYVTKDGTTLLVIRTYR